MIQIEHDTGDLKREARDLVKAIYDAPEPAAAGPSLARLREFMIWRLARFCPCCIGCVFGKSARRGLARGGGCRRLVRHEWLPLSSRFACSIPRPIVRALRRGRRAMPHRASFAFCRARPTGGRQSSAGLKPRRTRRVSVPEHDLVRRVHGLDVGTRRKMVLPRQESFESLHILTQRASEGSEALPSLARRVRMSFFGARVIAPLAGVADELDR